MSLSGAEMREIYGQTVVVRRPTFGIISGYHELPYVCIGESIASGSNTTCVKGKVQVSPRFVIRPGHLGPSYGDMFGADNVDVALEGRLFGFLGFNEKPVECKSEYLEVEHLDATIDNVLSKTLDELDRREDITTGVMITPNAQYYPVSIERFISTVIDDEFAG